MLHLILTIDGYLVQYLLGYNTVIVTGLAFTAEDQTCSGHLAKVCGAPAFVTTPNTFMRSAKTIVITACIWLTWAL